MGRSEIREHIFRILFGKEFHTPEELPEQADLYMDLLKTEREVREEDEAYIEEKSRKIEALIPEIDVLINEHTTGWKTGRMNKVEINEAVELAKRYSSDEGPAFINGVLAKLAD